MSDSLPGFEIEDNAGSTIQASGSVGTSAIQIPASDTTAVSEFIIQCPEEQDVDNRLLISLDGGTNYLTIYPSGHWAWTPKGGSVKHLDIKGNQAGVLYEVVVNLEAF